MCTSATEEARNKFISRELSSSEFVFAGIFLRGEIRRSTMSYVIARTWPLILG